MALAASEQELQQHLRQENVREQSEWWEQRRGRVWSFSVAAISALSVSLMLFVALGTQYVKSAAREQPPGSTAASSPRSASWRSRSSRSSGSRSGVEPVERKPKAKPNVFFILIDDMGWDDIGYQSRDLRAMTPNLNRMAEDGVKMTQYYTMSLCTPARAALMTGRYPIRYGFQYSIILPGAPWGLPLEEKLLPEYMNDAGYTSHMVGKWHLGGHTFDYMPHRRGFETHLGYTYGAETYWTHEMTWNTNMAKMAGAEEMQGKNPKILDFGFGNESNYYDVTTTTTSTPTAAAQNPDSTGPRPPATSSWLSPFSLWSSSSPSPSSPPSPSSSSVAGKYSTEVFTERALEILRGKTPYDEEPLFLYLAHQAVHMPLESPPDEAFGVDELAMFDTLEGSLGSSARVKFAKMLIFLDKMIGRLVDHLNEAGWLENSIIVVASDNGGCPYFGGSNHPLRGTKETYWEGGTKVPALVYSPSHIPEERWGQQYDGLMHVTDWLPTLASAAGFQPSGSNGDLDGVSHWEQIIKGTSRSVAQNNDHTDQTTKSSSTSGSSGGGDGGDGGLVSSSATYFPRSEVLYNYDPYVFVAREDGTISKPDFSQAKGAFRQGQWKLLFKACDWESDSHGGSGGGLPLTTVTNVNRTGVPASKRAYCSRCSDTCVAESACKDWLFDIEQDPREEYDLASVYPDVVKRLRKRVKSLVHQKFADSLYVAVDPNARAAWKRNRHDYWAVPWLPWSGSTREPSSLMMDDAFRIAKD